LTIVGYDSARPKSGAVDFTSMKKKARAPRTRTVARTLQRSDQKLQGLRHKLAELAPGGRDTQPIVVASASVIEPRAESYPCLRCGESTRVQNHDSHGEAERVVQLVCRACGAERRLFFRISLPMLN
jgi:hypothetical protein